MRCSLQAFVDWYATVLCKFRFVVLALWVLLAGGSAFFIMKFVQNTTQQFSPPDGTQAADAEAVIAINFPQMSQVSYFNIFIQLNDYRPGVSSPIIDNLGVMSYVFAVVQRLQEQYPPSLVVSIANVYDLLLVGMTEAAGSLIAPNGGALTIPIVLREDFVTKAAEDMGTEIQVIAANYSSLLDGQAYAVANGIPIFVKEIVKQAQTELGTMDAIAIPLAMIVMSLTLKSVRMMILPLISIGFTLAISFGVMYFVSLAVPVSSTTPSLMMSLCVAMSIDYNLFILSRYKEELHKGANGVNCISTVLRTAGHTILISGVTLLVCLLSLVFFPLNMLQSFGFGCGFAITIAMFVSLSFAPALLLTFPSFFEASVKHTDFPSWVPLCISRFFNSGGFSFEEYISSHDHSNPSSPTKPDADGAVFVTPRKDDASLVSDIDQSLVTNASSSTPSFNRQQQPTPVAGGSPGGAIVSEKRRLLSDIPATTISNSYRSVTSPSDLIVRSTSLDAQYYHRTKSVFYNLHPILKFPVNVIVFAVLVGCALGVGSFILHFKTTDSFESYLPRGSDVMNNFESFVHSFGYGYTQPYHIILSKNSDADDATARRLNATSAPFYIYFQGFLKRVVADSSVARAATSEFLGPLNIGNNWSSYDDFASCIAKGNGDQAAACNPNILGFVTGSNSMLSNVGSFPRAMYTIFITRFDPMGNLGNPYYKMIQNLATTYRNDVIVNASRQMNPDLLRLNVTAADLEDVARLFTIYFQGVGPSSMDAIDTIYRLFPIIIGVSVGAVLVVVGFAFRSVVMPIRSVVSIGVTQLFVFGLAVLVYQSPGILNWTTWGSVASYGAVSWTAPIVAFSVIVGVALDYDIFLLTRVVELVQDEGLSTNDAVLHALCSTGKIITSAGVIMAVAFFGLLLSETQILNLLGFFMVAAVLFDTFVIRTLVVPSLMSILGRWNWFPRNLTAEQ